MWTKIAKTALKSKSGRTIIIIGVGVSFLLTVCAMLMPVIAVAGVLEPITSAVKNAGSATVDFLDRFDHFLKGEGWSNDEEAFVRTLDKKYQYYSNRGVIINKALIMSTLMTKQLYISQDPSAQEFGEEYEDFDENRADVNEIPYGNMIGDTRKLAEHQVNKVFSLPSNADPTVYETVMNPPFAVLNLMANILNTTVDSLPLNNIRASNVNYLAYLRFGTYATNEQLEQEKNSNISSGGGGSTGEIRLTNFKTDITKPGDENLGYDGMSAYHGEGNHSERFRLDEKGWWWYKDPDTNMEYLAVAAATTYCLQGRCGGGPYTENPDITYYEYGDVITLNINGDSVQAMVVDSCGACMEATNPNKIDVYAYREYFTEGGGLSQAGIEAGAVLPDSLPTTLDGAYINTYSDEFWKYIPPTNEERSRVNDYKNGYIYKAYSGAFKTSNGDTLEGEALVQKVEQIIKTIYEVQDSYKEQNGSEVGDNTPIEQRTSAPNRSNTFYYDPTTGYGAGGTLEGECAWYGTARAKEFLASINSPETWTANPNGGQFCETADAQKFNQGNEPKAGSLVVWTGTSQYGHVAFVENVNDDGTFDISEAYIGKGSFGKSARSMVRSGGPSARRQNCEGNGTGCVNFQKGITTSTPYSGFKCFIYLREPKNGGQ